MKLPCDQGAIQSARASAVCEAKSEPWVLTAAILGSSMTFIDGTVVNVALPALQTGFGATVADVQWVVESYGLFLSALILVGGSMGDLFGRRRVFLAGVTMFTVASVWCGFAWNIHQLVIARAAQGIGAAFLVPGSLAIISASFSEDKRGKAIGTWSGFTAITTAAGPVLGGWLIENASWRWVFFINVPLAAAVVLITLRHVPESRGAASGRIDWLGALIITIGLGGVVGGMIESVTLGWKHPAVLGLLVIGSLCTVVFPLVETRVRAPMVPMLLFASRTFCGANLLTFFLYAALGVFFFLFPMNLMQVQGYSATATGAAALPLILLMFSLSRWSGGLVARWGAKLPLVVGPLIAAAGFLLFAIPSEGGSYWTTFFPAFVVLGVGMSISVAPLTTVVMSAVEQAHAGVASGINNAVSRVSGLLAIAVLGIVMVHAFSLELDRSLAHLAIPGELLKSVQSNRTKLGAITLPRNVDFETAQATRESIHRSFVFGFRIVVLICAALSFASAIFAWRMITNEVRPMPNGRRLESECGQH